jgi:hypothetical protein
LATGANEPLAPVTGGTKVAAQKADSGIGLIPISNETHNDTKVSYQVIAEAKRQQF